MNNEVDIEGDAEGLRIALTPVQMAFALLPAARPPAAAAAA